MKPGQNKPQGFTLLEILVATVITAFVAMVAVSTLRAITVGREKLEDHSDSAAELCYVAHLIKRDLRHLHRDADRKNIKLVGTLRETDGQQSSHLLLYTVNSVRARAEGIEGDLYEVEYVLQQDDDRTALMRRLCPNPEKEDETGGLLMALSENIVGFDINYYDGKEWQRQWPEEQTALPKMMDVTLTIQLTHEQRTMQESFLVTFSRWPQGKPETPQAEGEEKGVR